MNNHFRMCASAYRDGTMIDVTAHAGLPDACHDGKITRIGLENPGVLEIFIDFTRRTGVCDKMVWTWESRCIVPYGGQEGIMLIGTFEGDSFRQRASIPDAKPDYVACDFMVIANEVEHTPRLGCRSILAGTVIPKGYERVYPEDDTKPVSKGDCEAWRKDYCI